MDNDYFKTIFFEECRDLLQSAEENLTILSTQPSNTESLHALFRSVHSIKGGAGSFGLKYVIEFAHAFETVMDHLRSGTLKIDEDLNHVLFESFDILADLIKAAEQNITLKEDFGTVVQLKLENISNSISGDKVSKDEALKSSENNLKDATLCKYNIKFIPAINLMHYGNDPILVLKDLKKSCALPDTFIISLNESNIPPLSEISIDDCYMAWNISFSSLCDESEVQEVFDFVNDLSTISIEKIENTLETSPTEEPAVLSSINETKDESKNVIKNEAVHSLRVDLDRIDRLVNTVGEIVIKQSIVVDQALKLQDANHAGLLRGLHELSQYTRELQENVMAIRAQPIKTVFSRMPRVVRDLANELNKNVSVETYGENTEIDKTVIENLSEPLIHMIRNAIDHGIESTEERIAVNKPKEAKIIIGAEHKSGQIIIQIKDDGRGINREKVLNKAIEKGLVQSNANLSGEEIDNLIFAPGFSTAEKVTNVSGRGVGMDVVKRSIQALGGRIHLNSVEGKGCSVILTLPLTLAVLDGMVVSCGYRTFIIPLINILEIIRPSSAQIKYLVGGTNILRLRQVQIPLITLKDVFNITDAISDPSKGIVVIVETEKGLAGLVVDELIGQQQVVIKSLEANHERVSGISAATIMGNGNVAPILDIGAICSIKKSNFQ